jgi:hypothetical protein
VLGASVNYSPEFAASEPNFTSFGALRKSAAQNTGFENTGVQSLRVRRKRTFQPRDLWEWFVAICHSAVPS